jgi:non-specific serine/threonine protein kinase/serine/threonine-protein kinase
MAASQADPTELAASPTETLPLTAPPDPKEAGAGRHVGQYRLLHLLGDGGMGEVWLAEQLEPVKRRVALKIIKPGMETKQVVARFEAERQALALMDHPAIAKVLDGGATSEGRAYFVMEYIAGVRITEFCDAHRLTIEERLRLFMEVCGGAQHAHQKAIIHRDLKPSNILVTEVGGGAQPKIIDFGVAKAIAHRLTEKTLFTEAGFVIGTPEYMSPEQAEVNVQDVDTRTDVYALGVLLYELLTGRLPFSSAELRSVSYDELRRKLREVEPARPSVQASTDPDSTAAAGKRGIADALTLPRRLRGDLDAITMKALEKERARRYGTPSELAADIARYLHHEPVLARRPSRRYRIWKYVRRHRVGVAAATTLFGIIVAFAGTMAVQAKRISRERDRANREAAASKRVASFVIGMFKVADPGEARGNTITAREILEKASSDIELGLNKDPELQALMMSTMGGVYGNLGLLPRAEKLLRAALDTRRRVLGPEHPDTLRTMRSLASTLILRGQYPEAEKLADEAMIAQRRTLGPEHPDTLQSANTLGWVFQQEGRFVEAETLLRKTMAAQRRVVGSEDLATLATVADLAFTLQQEHKYPEAERLLNENLTIERRVFGPEHNETIASMSRLATTLSSEGRDADAEPLLREILKTRLRILGREHTITLATMNNLGSVLLREGRYPEADQLLREALDLQVRILGPEHPNTALTRYNLACSAALQGEREKALFWLGDALDHGLFAGGAAQIGEDPDLKFLHGDPRFEALVAKGQERGARVTGAKR